MYFLPINDNFPLSKQTFLPKNEKKYALFEIKYPLFFQKKRCNPELQPRNEKKYAVLNPVIPQNNLLKKNIHPLKKNIHSLKKI